MARVFLLVIDSLGVGFMEDCRIDRQRDIGANTFYHIYDSVPNLSLPTFESLGVSEVLKHKHIKAGRPLALYGCLNLKHYGADSYAGHQEIMGTIPAKPELIPFKDAYLEVKSALESAGYKVKVPNPDDPYLIVNEYVIVADNIETDFGQIYNVSGLLDYIPFTTVLDIGRIVRLNSKVSRVIALGGEGVSVEQGFSAIEKRSDGLIGMNCPKSGIYNKGYVCLHMGYGVDANLQAATLVSKKMPVVLVGKMQDVIECDKAKRIPAIETDKVINESIREFLSLENGLVASTVQETDLAGHAQNPHRYAEKLKIVDNALTEFLPKMREDDLLIITGDHGNDPCIGHSQHTREKTLLLAYSPSFKFKEKDQDSELVQNVGERETLSDIPATVCKWLGVAPPKDGTSFIG